MHEASARGVLLEAGVGPKSAPRWGIVFTTLLATSGCLAPVEAPLAFSDLNYPPEYDLRSITPASARLDVNPTDCPDFKVRVGRVWDKNDSQFLLRWVANNARPNTRLLRADTVDPDPGTARPSETRIVPRSDFASEVRLADESGTGVGTLSLFITDAPAWAKEAVDNPDQEALDLSEIIDDGSDGGPPAYSVVEVRWSVVFSSSFERCPL